MDCLIEHAIKLDDHLLECKGERGAVNYNSHQYLQSNCRESLPSLKTFKLPASKSPSANEEEPMQLGRAHLFPNAGVRSKREFVSIVDWVATMSPHVPIGQKSRLTRRRDWSNLVRFRS